MTREQIYICEESKQPSGGSDGLRPRDWTDERERRSPWLLEDVWGEHMHHGYYPEGKPRKDHAQAQVDMIDRSLEWAGVEAPVRRVVDVGCGIGGSSRHMARKYGCGARGITLSPVQAARANALTAEVGGSCLGSVARTTPRAPPGLTSLPLPGRASEWSRGPHTRRNLVRLW